MDVRADGAERELVEVRLADDDGAGPPEPFDHGCVALGQGGVRR
jgi:hypothetical protein